MQLSDGARVGVIGGGPAGTLAGYFLLDMAERVCLDLDVDIYEVKDFSRLGPAGCNMCGGVISESLVQIFATEGINLPAAVVQRGIDSYVLHTDRGQEQIRTPLEEMRIACVHRGSGPKGSKPRQWHSFDDFLLKLACEKGANHIPERVESIRWEDDRPLVVPRSGPQRRYDLVIGAVGVNARSLKLFEGLGLGLQAPKTTTACATEIFLGSDRVRECLGSSMHVFLLDVPGLKFAALIPKADYVTVCVLGDDVNQELLTRFMTSPQVQECLPVEWGPQAASCRCSPRINVKGARHCFADRIVLVGDCGVSRLYKDGIGAAYRAAKACAVTVVFHGVSKRDFEKHYWPTCRQLERDNTIGKLIFTAGALFRKLGVLRKAMLRMVAKEQTAPRGNPAMSMILWDTFTGSAPYREVLLRTLHPGFMARFLWNAALSVGRRRRR